MTESGTILLRPYNVWPEKCSGEFDGTMFYCLECGDSFPFLSWDGEIMWHPRPVSAPDDAAKHTLFTAWRLVDGERVPL